MKKQINRRARQRERIKQHDLNVLQKYFKRNLIFGTITVDYATCVPGIYILEAEITDYMAQDLNDWFSNRIWPEPGIVR